MEESSVFLIDTLVTVMYIVSMSVTYLSNEFDTANTPRSILLYVLSKSQGRYRQEDDEMINDGENCSVDDILCCFIVILRWMGIRFDSGSVRHVDFALRQSRDMTISLQIAIWFSN